ncbi:amidohydrolase family protein [Elizabethkingia anophelis]|uniref:amidohydrolase family protein n=1 Tax=Elizabethkingia anophelis TaxID=1117645 RepID=UPI000442CE57|nr:amidohydrolase family protein [Elizabethkingia anophelis]MCT4139906.1 amidohydrolase family protein [Elizabethkingia anophelis]MCT4274831.1 amidohydrolase family protein [Elizabethkingia anophelis]MCT4278923.1 amidohydrolase family protein [Elizabethkingia anophelis]CDN72887.1 putative deaminase/amidohydrolase with metallo-dependent hydrolase domain [Elizabethkingia anophelis]CDN78832.1 putative deaminase/amidohydrolase with metallo-dependent hydrolase domain [Elizabethkingia anophelis]
MNASGITRKDFIKSSALAVAGLAISPSLLAASPFNLTNDKTLKGAKNIMLKNVRLETGFEYEGNEVVATKTGLFCVEIANGKIKAVTPNNPSAKAIDAKGLLMLPAFKDMHIHLDKTFYGGPWQAVRKRQGGVKGMIALEQQILPEMLKTSTHHAEKLIELLQSCGTSYARSHVNIEPTSKLESLKNLQKALDNKKATFGAELVAFPQHGIYYTDSAPWMKEAAQTDIDYIGGVDPYNVDGQIEKTMDFTVQLALDHNKGIDIHLHETGESGLKTVEYLINKVNENPVLKGKTFLSHCFVLAKLDKPKQEEIAEKLANAKIGIMSTIPFGGLIMPIPTLYKYGVNIGTGNDSIIDHWNTWGSGSVLQKANLMAQLYGYSTEFLLSRSLKLATYNILPLDDKGTQQWPKSGDAADVVLIDASCSAEAVSRISPVKSLIHQGNVVF